MLPYGATCLIWALALWSTAGKISGRALWAIASLQVISIASTPMAAVALSEMQDSGFSERAHHQLLNSHLVRTFVITISAVLALADVWLLPNLRTPTLNDRS